jgi:hypothetical protein
MRHIRSRRLIPVVLAIGISAALAWPAASPGAVTIGSNLQNAPDSALNCSFTERCTFMQSTLDPGHQAPDGLTAPTDGALVSWSIRVGGSPSPVNLRVLREESIGSFAGAGTTLPVVAPPAMSTTTYPAHVAVSAGDRIGLDCCESIGSTGFFFVSTGASTSFWAPPLLEGTPARSPSNSAAVELLLQATIEEDADGDSYGDETQDQCPTDPLTRGPCASVAPPMVTGATGERSAALRTCVYKKKLNARKKCAKRARRLPL